MFLIVVLALFSLAACGEVNAWHSAGKRRQQAATTVRDLINSLYFFNSGTVYSNETYDVMAITSIYNEGYTYLGSGESSWTLEGHVSYLFRVELGPEKGPLNKEECSHSSSVGSSPTRHRQRNRSCQQMKNVSTPPSGMRSAVPLGALGGGCIELRADGRLADWQIFNNGPEAPGGHKLDVDQAAFGVLANGQFGRASKLLRTHPVPADVGLPAIHSLTYQGAFPAARLIANDSDLPIGVVLTAFSAFKKQSVNESITPAIAFHFNVSNPSSESVNASIFFNLPADMINGRFVPFQGKDLPMTGLMLQHYENPPTTTTGNLTMAVLETTDTQKVTGMSYRIGCSLQENWKAFATNGSFPTESDDIDCNSTHGAIAGSISIPPKSSGQIVILLTWFFPHHFWATEDIGNFYQNFYTSADDVADKTAKNLVPILQAVKDWNEEMSFTHSQPKFNEAFPSNFLDDSLMNSASTALKTTMFLRDGRWRQWESKSCSQMEPPSIHGYRSLFYIMNFPELQRQTVDLYADHMLEDGTVSELFGGGCFGASKSYNLDTAMGGGRGDDNAVFIIDTFLNWQFSRDADAFIKKIWPKLVLATQWQLNHAQYGLTSNLVNTFDEHGLMGNVNSYNAFMYLTSITAAQYLANYTVMKNDSMVAELRAAKEKGLEALGKYLWTGTFYRSFWCDNGDFSPEALQSDVLYGVVWSKVLNLDIGVPESHIVSHLLEERKRNLTPFGMQFCSNRTTSGYHCGKFSHLHDDSVGKKHHLHKKHLLGVGFTDHDTWEAATLNSGTLSLFTKAVSEQDALGLSALTLDKYRLTLNDFWDFRDLSSCYPDAPGQIRPVCNSHYSRQLIFWALLYALNGQKYDPNTRVMELSPRLIVSEQWPVFFGTGSGLMRPVRRPRSTDEKQILVGEDHSDRDEVNCYELQIYSGYLEIGQIRLHGKTLAEDISLTRGDIETFCH